MYEKRKEKTICFSSYIHVMIHLISRSNQSNWFEKNNLWFLDFSMNISFLFFNQQNKKDFKTNVLIRIYQNQLISKWIEYLFIDWTRCSFCQCGNKNQQKWDLFFFLIKISISICLGKWFFFFNGDSSSEMNIESFRICLILLQNIDLYCFKSRISFFNSDIWM